MKADIITKLAVQAAEPLAKDVVGRIIRGTASTDAIARTIAWEMERFARQMVTASRGNIPSISDSL